MLSTIWETLAHGALALSITLSAAWPLPLSWPAELSERYYPSKVSTALLAEQLLEPLPPLPRSDGSLPPAQGRGDIIWDRSSRLSIWDRQADLSLPMASLTKLMTAVVALEQVGDDVVVTIEPGDLTTFASESEMGLRAGDSVTVGELLRGLLIASANDAAEALARHAGGGSRERFVAAMNEKAALLGLQETQFANPTGLDETGHHSSARDLAILADYALRYELIREAVSAPSYLAHGQDGESYPLRSTNRLLHEGVVTGVKTGRTPAAGECLIALAEIGGREIITVTLGSPDRFGETVGLLTWTKARVTWQ